MKSLAMDTELWCYFMAYLFDEEIIKRLDWNSSECAKTTEIASFYSSYLRVYKIIGTNRRSTIFDRNCRVEIGCT
jgi:hypothetical protein